MELVRINGIIGKVISTNVKHGICVIEWFEDVSYKHTKELTVAINKCEILSPKFDIGDKVKTSFGNEVLTVAGYSGTYGKNCKSLPVVFDKGTWCGEGSLERNMTYKDELDKILEYEYGRSAVEKLSDLCERLIKEVNK